MTAILTLINWALFVGIFFFFLVLGISSVNEKETRAAGIAVVFFVLNGLVWTGLLFLPDSLLWINVMVVVLVGFFCFISCLRFFPGASPVRQTSDAEQYDERDNMFARNNIQYHPELMEQYHARRPENKAADIQIHQKPEFGEKNQLYYDAYTAKCYMAAFEYLEESIPLSTGKPAEQKLHIDVSQFCKTIIEFAKFYGACDVGFLRLKAHHFYSHKGRHAANWGKKTDQTYKTAITIVVPMRVDMIKNGPTSCVIQESAHKYVEAAKISNILAGYIRQFGHAARAHNDANYDTLCVPVAVETGLGELGRMGLFMHGVHGPCVRLAMVTTDLELPDSIVPHSLHMEEFCKICKKCADNCPSKSITHGDEPFSRNLRHWSIQQEKCFSYWKTIGSDCGLCISVCPYTKPDTFIHRVVRFYISRNIVNQKVALLMDDLLYGRYKNILKTNPDTIFISR